MPQTKHKREVLPEVCFESAAYIPKYGNFLPCTVYNTRAQPHRTKWQHTICKIGLHLKDKKMFNGISQCTLCNS